MALTPFIVSGFGGLNLTDDASVVGGGHATSLRNVDFDQFGRLKCRNAFVQVKALTLTTVDGFATFENTAGDKQFIVGYTSAGTSKYVAYGSAGGVAVATQTVSNGQISAARMGVTGAGQDYLFLANGVDTAWRWFSGAFAQPAGMPISKYLAVAQTSNRLVAGNIVGTSSSRVKFSDPGAPSTFTADNYVELTPGDGSNITGLVSWQNLVFAFKPGRFFVFTGESPDNDGAPIFNYRSFDGYGTSVPPVAGDEGVYFFDGRSIWLTTGDLPRNISRPVERALRGLENFIAVDQALLSQTTLSYALGRLYVSVPRIGFPSRGLLVYDPKIDQWTFYNLDLRFGAPLRRASTDAQSLFAFGYMTDADGLSSPQVMYMDTAADTTTPWTYTSGYYAIGDPGLVAVTNDSTVTGWAPNGNVSLTVTTDLAQISGTQAMTTPLGGLLDMEVWMSADAEGRRWQHGIAGTGSAYIRAVTHYISSTRAGVL